jgi:ABC-2 type transport system permease protein
MSTTFTGQVRTRGRWRKAVDTFGAYIRLDIIEDRMFPASTMLRYVAVVFPVLMYYFQADFLNAKDLYTSTLVGISVAAGLQEALTGFTARLQLAQERGTLETYLVEPVPWRFIPVAMNVWRSFTGMVITALMLAVGCAMGAEINVWGLPAFFLVLFLGVVACNAVGVFIASFLVLFKRGEPLIALYGVGAAFFGGSLFSISVLPEWIRWLSYLLPHSYVISAQRYILVPDPPDGGMSLTTALVMLVVTSIVFFAVGLRLFDRSLQLARRLGVLST